MKQHSCWTRKKDGSQKIIKKENICLAAETTCKQLNRKKPHRSKRVERLKRQQYLKETIEIGKGRKKPVKSKKILKQRTFFIRLKYQHLISKAEKKYNKNLIKNKVMYKIKVVSRKGKGALSKKMLYKNVKKSGVSKNQKTLTG